VLGSAGLLLAELHPGSMVMPIYLAPVLQSSEQEAIDEALAKLVKLNQRVPVVRENLSTLAGWSPLGVREQDREGRANHRHSGPIIDANPDGHSPASEDQVPDRRPRSPARCRPPTSPP
jgi:hypothetical protein